MLTDSALDAWQVPIGAVGASGVGVRAAALAAARIEIYDPLVLWWTDGSAVVEPSCLIVKGLPRPDSFAAHCSKARGPTRRWRSVATTSRTDVTLQDDADRRRDPDVHALGGRPPTSAGRGRTTRTASSSGRKSGIWAVADGMGGHSHGEVASRMVCDALADFSDGWTASRRRSSRDQADAARSTIISFGRRPSASSPDAQRQHGRRAARSRDPIRGALGRRQPRLPLARRSAGAADAGPQPGRTSTASQAGVDQRDHPRRRGRARAWTSGRPAGLGATRRPVSSLLRRADTGSAGGRNSANGWTAGPPGRRRRAHSGDAGRRGAGQRDGPDRRGLHVNWPAREHRGAACPLDFPTWNPLESSYPIHVRGRFAVRDPHGSQRGAL